ncbi:MAG: hypothetical protein QM664_09865 [Flavihumibacter sp.]
MIKRKHKRKIAGGSRQHRYWRIAKLGVDRNADFSDVEDAADSFRIIRDIAHDAGKNAAAMATAAGFSRLYATAENQLVRISPSGERVVVTPTEKKVAFFIKSKPSTVLHAVRKQAPTRNGRP